jgi:tetratricopeptide (TPR) repeat protein
MSAQFRFRACVAGVLIAALVLIGCSASPQAKAAKSLKRGEVLLEKKDFPRALLEFKNASQAKPNDAEPYYQMGLAYLGLSNVPAAAAMFRRATELDPKHDRAQLKLAEILTSSRNKGMVEEASKLLETVLANAPGNTEANDTLAVAEWQLGHTEDATARIEDTLQKFPANLKASVALAKMKLSQKDLAGAEEVLKKAVASAPQSSEAELALGQLYWVAKQPEKAEVEIRRALQLDPGSALALTGLAAIQTSTHRMDEAEETYRRLAALPAREYKHLHAVFLFQTGKREAALAEFVKLTKEDPDNRAARSRLVAAYVSMGKIAEAEQLLGGVLKKNPQDTDALLGRAELYLRAGNPQKAESDLNQVLHLKTDSAQAHFLLAEVYRAEGAVKTERQELNEAIRLNSSMLPARLALAKSLIASNEAASALEILNQTPQPQRTTLGVIVERNWALFATGKFKEERGILDQVLPAGRYPDLLIQDGVLRMRDGDYAGARAAADEVLRRNPEDVRAARILADSYVAEKQPLKAIGRLTELVQGHPKSAPLQYLLGQLYLASGKMLEARQAFEAAGAASPNFVQADLSLARMDLEEKRPDEARRHLVGVLTADPKNILALLLLADVESAAGNREGAISKYRAILDIDGANIFALNNLAWNLALDRPDEALKYAQQAGEIAPDNATVEDTLGWIYYRKGIYRTAVDYLKRAVAKESTPRRQFHLGMSYMKVGDRDLGQKTLSAALQKDPTLLKTEQGW